MKEIITKSLTIITIIAITLTLALPVQAEAKAKVKLNRTKATLTITDTKAHPAVQLKVTGTSKKVIWTTSNKTVAAVSKTGKVTARKKGTAVITAKVNRKSYKCKVTVKGTHKHHWVPHYDTGIENIEGVVCACGKVFTSGDDWSKHSIDEFLKHINEEGTGEHASWSGGKTIYITWVWHYDCDTCGFHDYDYKYPHPVKVVICSGCKNEFKDYDEWHKHFMENSLNGDESHRKCTVILEQ